MTLLPRGSSLRLAKLKAEWIGYVLLALWVMLILFMYLNMNRAIVEYCFRVYTMLLGHPSTLMLLIIPSLVVAVLATTICLVRRFIFKRT